MDRHRAPAMTRDSICFEFHVDSVCAVGCDRPKVLAAMKAVKATLDAAGLQCSETEADTPKQVFAGFQLDHENGILSLEDSRIWRLRHGLEFAACQKQLTGDQVAKLIGHITWGYLLRRPAESLVNAWYRFARTFGPRSGRLWPAVAQEFRWIASLLPLLTCAILPLLGHRSMLQIPRAEHMVTSELRVAGVTKGMRQRQGAVQNGGGFRRKNLSGLDDQCWSNLSWKLRKPLGLESRLFGKLVVLTCILLWLVSCGKVFIQRLLSSKMCHRPSFSPSLPGASCLEVVSEENHWKSCEAASCLSVY